MKKLEPFKIRLSGVNLIEASAGTGKTYNITSLYVRTIVELDIPVNKILVVTYTEAATKELKDRLLRRVRESVQALKTAKGGGDPFMEELLDHVDNRPAAIRKLERALRSFDEAAVYTIHGFCYQSLQEQAFESRTLYGADLIGDDTELVLEAVDDYWRNWVADVSEQSHKRPLLKYLSGQGINPDSLAKELGGFLGQPYLNILPRNDRFEDLETRLCELQSVFEQLREIWGSEREKILSLLSRKGVLRNYRSHWLEKWMMEMDDFLASEVASIGTFKQFKRFTQSQINDCLMKKADKAGTAPPRHAFFDCAEKYEQLSDCLSGYEVILKRKLLLHLWDIIGKKKQDLQVLSYDDLLLQLKRALEDQRLGQGLARKMREKYPVALVDEFQDTDPCQYDIFRRIYTTAPSESALFMIGDPKQSIYSFRGADVYSYLQAKKDADGERVYNLGRNFRSSPGLLHGINKLFTDHPNPFILDRIGFEPVEAGRKKKEYKAFKEYKQQRAPVRFRLLNPEGDGASNKGDAMEKVSADTAGEIFRLLEAGKKSRATIGADPVQAKDIAVLVRTHYQAGMMSEALRQQGIKSVQYSQESVFQSEEARQIEILLKAIAEPGNESLIKTALSVPLMDCTAAQLLEIEEDEEGWMEILDRFSRWHKRWQEHGFAVMFRSLLKEAGISEYLIRYGDGERRLTNVIHIGELLQAEDQVHKSGTRSLLKWLRNKREETTVRRDEEQLRLESDEELVKIVTMHRSKGLEYPIVFCPFLWHGPEFQDYGQPLVYHDPDEPDKTYLDLNGKTGTDRVSRRMLAAREELAENMRLAYVAMTRAEQCCYLSWIYAHKSEFSPLGYLLLGHETVFERLKQTISDKYEALGGEKMEEAIRHLCSTYPELFTMQGGTGGQSTQLDLLDAERERPAFLSGARTFKRPVPLLPGYQVSSFSSLNSWMEEAGDLPDYDQFLDVKPTEEEEDADLPRWDMVGFPKGPQPGTCIHKIFEDINFSDPGTWGEVITRELEKYGMNRRWKPVVEQMLHTVLNTSLLCEEADMRLSALKREDYIEEMEFYYKSDHIFTADLLSIIRNKPALPAEGVAEPGFLKGFIDLTFRFGERYYLLDYKTNYLGDTNRDYGTGRLEKEMQEANYDLQYHIYTVALHRFLSTRLAGYSYEKHFGGALYLFLRGMNESGREGIFFDRPDFTTIQKLDHHILSGGDS